MTPFRGKRREIPRESRGIVRKHSRRGRGGRIGRIAVTRRTSLLSVTTLERAVGGMRATTNRGESKDRERVAGKKLPSVSFSLVAVTAMFQRISTLRGARKPAPRVIDVTARLFAFLLRFTDVFSFLLSNIVFHHECANRRITVSSLNSIHIFITVAQSGASSFFKRCQRFFPPLRL